MSIKNDLQRRHKRDRKPMVVGPGSSRTERRLAERLIFIRGRWEIALAEVNAVTGEPQWTRRDGSYICRVGEEVALQAMPEFEDER